MVIVDEASMAGTFDLDRIATAATDAGAKVLLVGDWAQLSPVQACGAFKLLADARRDAPELHDVRRFRHEWERTASLDLRRGRASVAETYAAKGRVESGTRQDMVDLIFEGWREDARAGRSSLMLAADAETVAELNARARAWRVGAGEVAGVGARMGDGTVVGVGDVVVTRLNRRALVTGSGWVTNGDDWVVQAIGEEGAMRARRAGGGAVAVLPGEYVAENLELGYATTAHRAQGRTVDTAHAYVTATTVREPLYVMVTRGRESNRLYVDTAFDPDAATGHGEDVHADAGEVLQTAITTSGVDLSATEARRAEAAIAAALWRIEARGAAVMEQGQSRCSRDV